MHACIRIHTSVYMYNIYIYISFGGIFFSKKVLRREIADINETWSSQRNPLYQRQVAGAQEAGGGAGGSGVAAIFFF